MRADRVEHIEILCNFPKNVLLDLLKFGYKINLLIFKYCIKVLLSSYYLQLCVCVYVCVCGAPLCDDDLITAER